VLKVSCHEDIWGSLGIALHILNLSTKWRWVNSFITWLLYPWGKSPWYPLEEEGKWATEPLWVWWCREKNPSSCWESKLYHPAHSI